MRIVAGQWRGRVLKSPAWDGLRPTSDRLRETLFNILGPSVDGVHVLDGFAGTGAIGIEALSRGAAEVVFVEQDPRAAALIEANLALVGGVGVIIRAGFAEAPARLAGRLFEIVFLDPPYAAAAADTALAAAAGLLAEGGRAIVEHATRHAPPIEQAGLRRTRTVKAGDSSLSFYER